MQPSFTGGRSFTQWIPSSSFLLFPICQPLLENGIASCGLCFCGAKSVGLQDVDLFCPNFLGRSASDPPVSKMLSAKQSVRQASHFHLAAFPVGFACRWSAALGNVCGWFHLISDPATRPQGTDGRNGIQCEKQMKTTESHNISQYCTCGDTRESGSLGSPVCLGMATLTSCFWPKYSL